MGRAREKRTYDAALRRKRAAESQERVLPVAHRLFAESGYKETTMEAIAIEAGVAAPTIYAAFGSKHGILSRLLVRLVSGEPGAASVLETSEARAVLAEPNARRALDKFAQHLNRIQERIGPVYEVMKNAARSESGVAALYNRAQSKRFSNLEAFVASLAGRGPLRAGLSAEDAARTVWVLASPEVRQMLLVYAGWPPERYSKWLSDTLFAALLPPSRHTRGSDRPGGR